MRCRLRDERGSNAVEFALVLPILIMIMFGIFYGGLAYDRQLTLTQGAREGARFGATLPTAPTDDFFDDVFDVALGAAGRHVDASGTDFFACVRFVPESGTPTTRTRGTGPPGACTLQGTPPSGPHLQVMVARTASLELVFFRAQPLVRGEAFARYEGPS
ncbi:TadE/TadG family type IV pilus assembly protein [Nitriliruptor alkaliphilus]|uniref:TadE/TadG family type IV pilus assembly protein n=1 Tax=Nitriliruptor alkaliphilus TaxID=427918 RepID=UPI000695E660|nr:TadE family protein [Nitriliruptor alkaliphilus]